MKKLFISCPMRDRTDENIRNSMARMHKIAEGWFGEELEVIPTYIPDSAPENITRSRIWYLGESIKMMSEADYFIGIEWDPAVPGCNVEREVAMSYKIPFALVAMRYVMPDAYEISERYSEDI